MDTFILIDVSYRLPPKGWDSEHPSYIFTNKIDVSSIKLLVILLHFPQILVHTSTILKRLCQPLFYVYLNSLCLSLFIFFASVYLKSYSQHLRSIQHNGLGMCMKWKGLVSTCGWSNCMEGKMHILEQKIFLPGTFFILIPFLSNVNSTSKYSLNTLY